MDGLDWGVLFRPEFRAMLWKGLWTTLQLTAYASAGALAGGIAIALLRSSGVRAIAAAATAFVEGTRTVPLLVHLMFWYYGAPELLPEGIRTWLYARDVGFWSALVALVLYASAFVSEDLRSGIRGIPAGQLDAARSLGFARLQAFRFVILPQALRATVPPLLGQAMTLTKNTTISLVIGVPELAHVTRTVQSASFQSVSVYVFTTLFFLLMALMWTGLARFYAARVPRLRIADRDD
ncbi:MAG TPA: amino acid ABC transporter permease [Ramlibacter sp.]|uniref:amino acid ABC transporter permease n=1 Tax=Ramlibacter sp. TaxID=1917967 RepID=UPI002B6F6E19|nr:amino acid ABC transporter permease [Ramlibacter sp.]HVZ43164.1 amino acid ABC transporter permease [Ramlibacter sp.]